MAKQERGLPGFPDEGKMFDLQKFGGINTRAPRQGIGDNEFFWLENLFPIDVNNCRTLNGQSAAVFTAIGGLSIVYFFHYVLLGVPYVAVFMSDGTAKQVNLNTSAITTMSSATGTFYNSTFLPYCCQWGNTYLLIISRTSQDPTVIENGYFVWDGTVLYKAGTIAPIITITNAGENYTSAPSVTFSGGAGSGATATAVVRNGSVIRLIVTNAGSGYGINDVVAVNFAGGGSTTNAIATASLSGDKVSAIAVNNGGTGYTGTPTVTLAGGGGIGALAVAALTATTVASLSITSGGSGYTSAPTVTIAGGGGTGATATSAVTGGIVSAITITNAGSGYTGTPVATFSGGAGTGAAATVNLTPTSIGSVVVSAPGFGYITAPTVLFSGGNTVAVASGGVMPFGLSGTSMETFSQRVWVGDGPNVVFSNPGSFVNFSTSGGGGAFSSTDSFLKTQYINLKQANGFLYPMADSSVNIISNVTTTGTAPATTTFNNQNADPQVGTPWRDAVQVLGNDIIYSNTSGVYTLRGGRATKISDPLDGLFASAQLSLTGTSVPSAAVAIVYGIKVYFILITGALDPFNNTRRNILAAFDGKKWFLASQESNITFVNTQLFQSQLTAWFTDGTSLYRMLNVASSTLVKKGMTKLWSGETYLSRKRAVRAYAELQDNSSSSVSLNVSVDAFLAGGTSGSNVSVNLTSAGVFTWVNNSGVLFTWTNNAAQPFTWTTGGTFINFSDNQAYGNLLGYQFNSTSPDFTLNALSMTYRADNFVS